MSRQTDQESLSWVSEQLFQGASIPQFCTICSTFTSFPFLHFGLHEARQESQEYAIEEDQGFGILSSEGNESGTGKETPQEGENEEKST